MRLSFSSDWLNPMLLRDLRQVLRSRSFTMAFLLLQGAMAFFVVLELSTSEEQQLSGTLNYTLWAALTLFYLIILPLTAAGSLTPEFRENRLDLLKLTQMSARGLTVGKWLSMCSQGLMVAVSLLPYIVLSYYAGGVELTSELIKLGLLLAFSSVLIGFCLAISSMNNALMRGLVMLFFGFCIFFGLIALSNPYMRSGGGGIFAIVSSSGGYGIAAAFLAAIGLPALWLSIEFGAARLAPAAENHDTPQRLMLLLLGLVGFGILALHTFTSTTGILFYLREAVNGMIFFLIFGQMIWVLMQAMATEPSPYPDAYRFFARGGASRRWLGRLAGYPGWPSAVFLILFLSVLFISFGCWLSLFNLNFEFSTFFTYCLVIPAAVIFPQLAALGLKPTRYGPGYRYGIVLAGCFILLLGCWLIANASVQSGASIEQGYLALACLLPPNAFILLPTVNWDLPEQNYAIAAAIAGGVPTVLIGVIRAIRHWPKFADLERRAAVINAAAKQAKTTALADARGAPVSAK